MEKIQEIVDLLDKHIDDNNFAKSQKSKIQNEITQKRNIILREIEQTKNNIIIASKLEKSIKKNERNVYLEFLYSFIIIGLILYLIF